MLVLRRSVGESIVLAGTIEVQVLAVEGERVKIGVVAPPDVTIVRKKLVQRASHPHPSGEKERQTGGNDEQ